MDPDKKIEFLNKLANLLEEYGVDVCPVVDGADLHGVECGLEVQHVGKHGTDILLNLWGNHSELTPANIREATKGGPT